MKRRMVPAAPSGVYPGEGRDRVNSVRLVGSPRNDKQSVIYFYLILLLGACFLDVYYGAVSVHFSFFYSLDESSLKIIQIRCTEMLQALMAGSILALCGGVLQKILKNPLADPFILGISSGGSCFSAIFVMLNLSSSFYYLRKLDLFFPLQSLVSLTGCMLALGFIYYFKNKIKSSQEEYSYLIIGIILNSFFSAALMITISLADQSQLSQIHTWLIGSLQPVSTLQILVLITVCLPCIFLILKQSSFINLLLFEDDFAKSLGIHPNKIRNKLVFLICILISIVVSISGAIGFVGLIVPHYIRKLHKSSVKNEFILTMICGSIILVVADLLSRVLLPPSQLPIGIFTALIGAPALAFILLRTSRA